jgi:Flp pilus assembly protein TadD
MRACLLQVFAVLFVATAAPCLAQTPQSDEKLIEQARQEYAAGEFADAERDFRMLTKRDSSNVEAHVYLGQALFRQEKYAEAVFPYECHEKALELERANFPSVVCPSKWERWRISAWLVPTP